MINADTRYQLIWCVMFLEINIISRYLLKYFIEKGTVLTH